MCINGTVNEVTNSLDNLAIADEDEVNAVSRKFQQRQAGPSSNRFRNQQRRKTEQPASSSAPNSRSGTPTSAPDRGKPPTGQRFENKGAPTVKKLCKYHVQFGDKARTCERGCDMFSSVPSNGKAGRQT